MLTLGSSFSKYLVEKGGIPTDKVSTGFHYVDLEHYNKLNLNNNNNITIITMSNLQNNLRC